MGTDDGPRWAAWRDARPVRPVGLLLGVVFLLGVVSLLPALISGSGCDGSDCPFGVDVRGRFYEVDCREIDPAGLGDVFWLQRHDGPGFSAVVARSIHGIDPGLALGLAIIPAACQTSGWVAGVAEASDETAQRLEVLRAPSGFGRRSDTLFPYPRIATTISSLCYALGGEFEDTRRDLGTGDPGSIAQRISSWFRPQYPAVARSFLVHACRESFILGKRDLWEPP